MAALLLLQCAGGCATAGMHACMHACIRRVLQAGMQASRNFASASAPEAAVHHLQQLCACMRVPCAVEDTQSSTKFPSMPGPELATPQGQVAFPLA